MLRHDALAPPRSAISFRSVALGLAGTILIAALTPYNDYALNNTFLIGNNLPLGWVMLLFLFSLLVNGPLSRWWPQYALTSGEVAVAFGMTLVSCAVPSGGLMRYFPGVLTGPIYWGRDNAEFRAIFEALHIPNWLYPSFRSDARHQWMNDPIVDGLHNRWTERGPIPYSAWIPPALTWGVFFFALWGALLFLVTILRRQWFENQ